jgi:hypothetical protein
MQVRWPEAHLPVAQMQDRSPLESIRGPGFRQLRRTNRAAVLHLSTSGGRSDDCFVAGVTVSRRELCTLAEGETSSRRES